MKASKIWTISEKKILFKKMYHEKDECRGNDESHGPDQVFRVDGISKTTHYRNEEIDRLAEK